MNAIRLVLGALCLTLWTGAHAQTGAVPTIRPAGPALEVKPPFGFNEKTRRSASGIACSPQAADRRCLVVFDEGTKAQFASLGAKRLKPIGAPFELTGKGGELDAESAALSDGYYYVAGSHSVKRKSCKSNEASRMLVRFKAGTPGGSPPDIDMSEMARSTRLWDLMLEDPYLKQHVDGCLGDGNGPAAKEKRRPGINIEGIAMVGGRLYAGFRGPSDNGVVPVFSVNADALFKGGDAKPLLHRLSLGAHVGIRDMSAARDSILLLLGPDDVDAGAGAIWRVAQWKPGTTAPPRLLATLDARKKDVGDVCFDELKPEALAILDESPSGFRVLVLSDGVCDGGPLIFEVPQ